MFICYIIDNRRDKDWSQIGWLIALRLQLWHNKQVIVEGVHLIWWQNCFCLQSPCKFSRNKPSCFPQTSYSPSRVTEVSVAAAAAARSEQPCGLTKLAAGCWQHPGISRNILMFDGNVNFRPKNGGSCFQGWFIKNKNKTPPASFIYMHITLIFICKVSVFTQNKSFGDRCRVCPSPLCSFLPLLFFALFHPRTCSTLL